MIRLLGRARARSVRRPGGLHEQHRSDSVRRVPSQRAALHAPQDQIERRQPGGEPRWSPTAGLWSALGGRSVAGQVFLLQVVIALLLVAAAVVTLVLQVRHDSAQEARHRSLAVAETFANVPGTREALSSTDPTAVLQPQTEAARKRAEVDFIVVMNTDGIRYTHPKPDRIGKKFVGNIAPALTGSPITEQITGTLGPLVQAVVPVKAPDGSIVGLVSAGITTEKVGGLVDRQLPILLAAGVAAVTLAMAGTALVSRRLMQQTRGLGPSEMTRMYEHHDAVLHAVREGVIILDGEGRLLLANDEAHRLLGLPDDTEGRHVHDLGLDSDTAELLASGRVATDEVHLVNDRLLAINQRPTALQGAPSGSVATLRDSTELRALSGRAEVARERLNLLYDAGVGIGTTLDVTRTAEELVEVTVPRFADFVTVDLAHAVLSGEEPDTGTTLRRTAFGGIRKNPLCPVGEDIAFVPSSPQARSISTGQAHLEADLSEAIGWMAQDAELCAQIVDYGIHSLITVPLRAGPLVMGVATFWRSEKPEPFEEEELALAEELVTRAAVSIDNARRYTREHAMAVTLQRSLLPRSLPDQSALDVAYRYLPAQASVGGDWFDVLPLPGARVAVVVGDVVGHGLHAAATMGRLRTAVHNFSALDLPPDELLGLLDELVTRIDQDEAGQGGGASVTGATCLYAIYDPVSRHCTVARAGHPPPAVVRPDGAVEFPEVPAGPPLGVGGLPFQAAKLELGEGSRLVLYTDGLVEDRERDIGTGFDLLRTALLRAGRGTTPDGTCQAVLDALLTDRPTDDIALIVADTRAFAADRVADWQVPTDPAAVSNVRASVSRQLSEWGLEELEFTTELILSELVTNAIRYGNGPIRVRMLYDRSLLCEVSDTSSTSPHLRYAADTDEGGRGLFLIAQLSERWGTRYTPDGKIIWAEQPIP